MRKYAIRVGIAASLLAVAYTKVVADPAPSGPDSKQAVLTGHRFTVTALAFSPDGKLLASASWDKTVKVWEVASGRNIATFEGHGAYVNAVAFRPDGKTLASAGDDNTIRLWDLASGKNTAVLKGHSARPNSLTFSPDGKTLVSGALDGTVRIWDLETNAERAALKARGLSQSSVTYNCDGKLLAAILEDYRTLQIWDVAGSKAKTTLKGHVHGVYCRAFSRDGALLASGEDEVLKLWDLVTGKDATTYSLPGRPTCLAFSPDGKYLASGYQINRTSKPGLIRIIDAANGKEVGFLKGHTRVVGCLAFSPDGKLLVSGALDSTIRLWDWRAAPRTPPEAPPAEKPPPPKTIDELIALLANRSTAAREEAWDGLTKLGQPALDRLHDLAQTSEDMEVRRRVREALWDLDVEGFRRPETLKRRAELRKEIAALQEGQPRLDPKSWAELRKEFAGRKETEEPPQVDAKNWGEDIANPFTALTPEGKDKLAAEGVDVDRLLKLKAVLLTGDYDNWDRRRNVVTFVNRDPDTILVLGEGFNSQGKVLSLGPVLVHESTKLTGLPTGPREVIGADLVWCFKDLLGPRCPNAKGAPFILESVQSQGGVHQGGLPFVKGDYGWRRPDDFLDLPALDPGAPLPPLAIADLEKKKKQLRERIAAANGVDAAERGGPVPNPFTKLSRAGKTRLRLRGVDPERLAKLKAVLLTGSYQADPVKPVVNRDPETILVIHRFNCPAPVFSLGPILTVGDPTGGGAVTSADLVWYVEKTEPRGAIAGLPVIFAPSVRDGRGPGTADVWCGDYGWRRPDDLLKPVGKPAEKKE